MPHKGCKLALKVEPGYIYRKKKLHFEHLNPIEEAKMLKKLVDSNNHGNRTVEHMALEGYGCTKTIYRKLSLLKLPKQVQKWVANGTIYPFVGVIIQVIKDETTCISLARRVITERLSTRQIKSIVEQL